MKGSSTATGFSSTRKRLAANPISKSEPFEKYDCSFAVTRYEFRVRSRVLSMGLNREIPAWSEVKRLMIKPAVRIFDGFRFTCAFVRLLIRQELFLSAPSGSSLMMSRLYSASAASKNQAFLRFKGPEKVARGVQLSRLDRKSVV